MYKRNFIITFFCLVFAGQSHANLIQFDLSNISPFGGPSQSSVGGATLNVLTGGSGLNITGNWWAAVTESFQIKSDTRLRFDFSTSDIGEVHGIGFASSGENNVIQIQDRTFQLLGVQTWGIQDFRINVNEIVLGQIYSFDIDVGNFFIGTFDRIIFAMDSDGNHAPNIVDNKANSSFSNVSVVSAPSTFGIMVLGFGLLLLRKRG